MQQTHRSGPLKHVNKIHTQGKHRSKRHLDEGGQKSLKVLSKKASSVQRKNDRRHQAQQVRKRKREEVMMKKRSVGSSGTPPHCVMVVPLHADVSVKSVIETLSAADDAIATKITIRGITHMSIQRFKHRIEFLPTQYGNLYSILDGAKVAESVLFVMAVDEGLDSFGDFCMSCILGQGISAVTIVVQGMKTVPQKKQKEVKKMLQKVLDKWFPHEKIHTIDTATDCLLVLRHITSQKLKPIHYRDNRPYLLVEEMKFEPADDSLHGTLTLTGYLRSQPLSVNRLVHLCGLGDFQLTQLDILDDPFPLQPKLDKNRQKATDILDSEMTSDMMTCEALSVLHPNPSKQESLESLLVPDPMENEQTWPTEEELAAAENDFQESQKAVKRRLKKGMSDYQATWILDDDKSDNEEDNDIDDTADVNLTAMDDEDESDNNEDVADEMLTSDSDDEEEYEDVTVERDKDAEYDQQMDMQEEQDVLAKIKQEKFHVMFPDEVDTPLNVDARTRFQKYRGLKSFRTSPWDSKIHLPLDYSRIFRFSNFKRLARKILNSELDETELEESAMPWSFVRLHVGNVPKTMIDEHTPNPLVVFGLLPDEHKMSVINIVLRKSPDISYPVQSKEMLTFHVGFRRFTTCPIFSQHTNGNKHKFERFLSQDTTVVATMFAPIMYPPAPVLVFKDKPFGAVDLVAKGSFLSVDPDRIVTKRVVLSGYPLKINKRSCVVRYMFFNREDIIWFMPVELRTKWGRRGHIKVPLGTHGHMKCVFDGQLKSQDTILMNLYKRVFPKWTYSPHVMAPTVVARQLKAVAMETINEHSDEDDKDDAAYGLFD